MCALIGVPLRARLVLAAAVIAVYVPLAGGGPSIQRAGVMGVAGLVAALAGRPARRWYALLLAAAVTLALNPRAVGEPGWQLSFAAVAALLVGAAPLRRGSSGGMPGPVAEAAAITIAATVGTAPLMALHFEQVSLAALPANLLAAPAIAPVMWLGVLACAAAQIAAPLATPFSLLAAPLLVYVQRVAHVTAATPFVGGRAPAVAGRDRRRLVPCWPSSCGLRAPTLGRDPWGEPPRRHGPAWLAVAGRRRLARCSTRQTSGPSPPPAAGELVVSFLDIGQGDATLHPARRDGGARRHGPARRADPHAARTRPGSSASTR